MVEQWTTARQPGSSTALVPATFTSRNCYSLWLVSWGACSAAVWTTVAQPASALLTAS